MRFEFWDGSSLGPPAGAATGTLIVRSPDAIRRIIWCPNELGFGRAYVAGELDAEGDVVAMIEALRDATHGDLHLNPRGLTAAIGSARRLGLGRRPPAPPPEEARIHGWLHSMRRDANAISHHYDVGNDFYRIVLGPSMTYSCARFIEPDADLETAQQAKHELICRKLGLHERRGARLLDVGCGWGSMAIHAAAHHGASVVGITLSRPQAELARERITAAGVADLVEIRVQDYRMLRGERFDAVSSIGMAEHVGAKNVDRYFEILRGTLAPHGRLLNHAISSVGGSRIGRRSFIGRYVFPDGELLDVAETIRAMERAGFEVRDVESLREHYASTLSAWVANLETNWDEAVRLAGTGRARVWRLYMAASAVGFTDGGVSIHQVLGVVPSPAGSTAMPATRRAWDA
ncbi:MAG: cyclopropane-fatty-acyl-phospholipid synthase family protein [Actinomycetota bacterium]|nr:cyclopropane-fatty-acyl-phospholipid synthase family protein [Actinomycetota bacterium]